MYCPKCKDFMIRARLDVYWCLTCKRAWLLHKLKYKTFEEASEVNDGEQLRQDFLEPLILPPRGRQK